MGLCKCKVVTNQFCFEHKVNVCEYCMVKNHPKCIVQSYLRWLNDSDYNPICTLCQKTLADQECIRLLCYDVFHWRCLDQHCRELPARTAPAGYTCPACKAAMFPPSNLVSPVADVLRSVLAGVNWARAGLGLPVLEEIMTAAPKHQNPQPAPEKGSDDDHTVDIEQHHNHVDLQQPLPPKSSSLDEGSKASLATTNSFYPSPLTFSGSPSSSNHRKFDVASSFEHDGLLSNKREDRDENKYRRKSPFELLHRWLRSHHRARTYDPRRVYKRYMVLALIGLIVVVYVLMWMARVGRSSAESDPLLDPLLNPNIHIQDGPAEKDS